MRPHPQDANHPQLREHLADQAVLDVDAAREGAGEVADELLERRRRTERVDRDHSEKNQSLLLEAALGELLGVTNRSPGENDLPGSRGNLPWRSSLLHQSSFFTAFESGSAIPSRIDSRMQGIDSR